VENLSKKKKNQLIREHNVQGGHLKTARGGEDDLKKRELRRIGGEKGRRLRSASRKFGEYKTTKQYQDKSPDQSEGKDYRNG